MATHAHRVPLSTGDGTRVSVRGTLHVVEIVARNPAGYAQAGGEPKPCQVTRTRGSPGCGVSVTAVRRDAICRSAPMPLSEGGIGRSRRDLCGNTAPGRQRSAQMCFPCGNPFVLPATRCALNYKRTLTVGGGKNKYRILDRQLTCVIPHQVLGPPPLCVRMATG